ncbi:hypothetical protein LEMLEM_LOCUS20154 [Lemmus lemmus]
MSSVSTQECRSGWRGFSDGMLGEGEARSCRLSRATFVHTCPQAPQEGLSHKGSHLQQPQLCTSGSPVFSSSSSFKTTCSGVALPVMDQAFPHESSIMKMSTAPNRGQVVSGSQRPPPV